MNDHVMRNIASYDNVKDCVVCSVKSSCIVSSEIYRVVLCKNIASIKRFIENELRLIRQCIEGKKSLIPVKEEN